MRPVSHFDEVEIPVPPAILDHILTNSYSSSSEDDIDDNYASDFRTPKPMPQSDLIMTWNRFKSVVENFLGNHKFADCAAIIESMILISTLPGTGQQDKCQNTFSTLPPGLFSSKFGSIYWGTG